MGHVKLEHLSKTYSSGSGEEVLAVDDANLEIENGEFVILVGPSGSGKSTLLRCIAGLEEVTDGKVFIDDEEISSKKPRNRDIAMVFQNYALYPHLDASGNMGFGLKMRGGYSTEEINDRVEEAAEIMGIEELLDDYPRELSGGQQQRVSLGRAIVRDPDVFLMDEPLSNLDAKLRTTMRTELQRLQDDLGVTTIYVTHDQTEAMTMSDRIVIMNEGRIQQIGTPLQVYYKPTNLFVAGFIGSPSMNFITVSVRREGENVILENEGFSYHISSRLASEIPAGTSELVLGIRPEDIEVDIDPGPNSLPITIDVLEPLGKEQLLYFDIAGNEYIASTAEGAVFPTNSTVEIHFPEEQIHLFDAETGEAIVNCEYPEMEDRQQFADQLGKV